VSYPYKNDIIDAAKDSRFIKDPFFEGSSINILKGGRPDMYGGGFSQVFPILKDNKRWAFKVWTIEIKDNRNRYDKILRHLRASGLPYFAECHYVENGILVLGDFIDTLRMEWVEATKLSEYISLHRNDPKALEQLAETFLIMTRDLKAHSISHGDLHQDNILVQEDGKIKLIDYDSMCVPELDGEPDICRGRYDFQHPCRITAGLVSSTKIDYFSELIIYLSILAVSENPVLWDKYDAFKAERLLFKRTDFISFEDSPLRSDLNLLSPKISGLVKILEKFLAAHLMLPPFDE
jgi:serine/threonine protein kinase